MLGGGDKELWDKNRADLRSLAFHAPDEKKMSLTLSALHGDSHKSLEMCCLDAIIKQQETGISIFEVETALVSAR